MEQPLIEFRNVSKSFGAKTVLKNVNFKIYKGQVTTVIGKSGTGKSVMLKHIIGLLAADEGSILFNGKDTATMKGREYKEYLSQLSYMFQNNALFDSMTVYENVAFPLRQTTDLSESEIEGKVMDKLEKTDLVDVAHKFPSELSGGMQKRVAFSRALVTEPKIVLFDEPTTGQDLIRRNAILSMISEYKKKFGFTAIVISHDIPDILFVSNRVLVLHQGNIVFQGTPAEFEEFDHPFVDEFIHSLEGFQEHMTGLYSKRGFKMRYQNALNKKHPDESYVIVIFSIANFGALCEQAGHITAQELVKELGSRIRKHFDAVGGFSARQRRSRFITVLPFSNMDETQQLIKEFGKDLQKKFFKNIKGQGRTAICYPMSVIAAVAEGEAANEKIDNVLQKARKNLYEIAKFKCGLEGVICEESTV